MLFFSVVCVFLFARDPIIRFKCDFFVFYRTISIINKYFKKLKSFSIEKNLYCPSYMETKIFFQIIIKANVFKMASLQALSTHQISTKR